MIELIPTGVDNIIGFTITGKISSSDFDSVLAAIEEKLKTHSKLRVYAEIQSFQGISFEALIKDIQFTFTHFRDFEKEAVVSQKQWLKQLANIGDKLFPSV
ncbi:MAG: STAS/SEC14 domain-containing protein, partial [Chroococcales cyanobacterium]